MSSGHQLPENKKEKHEKVNDELKEEEDWSKSSQVIPEVKNVWQKSDQGFKQDFTRLKWMKIKKKMLICV